MRGAETKWQRLGDVARDMEMVSRAGHFAYQEAPEVIFLRLKAAPISLPHTAAKSPIG